MSTLIDSHHHIWDPAIANYPWMTDALDLIRRKFDPEDLREVMGDVGVTGTVLVQTRSDFCESTEFLAVAEDTDFIIGVVAWADLTAPNVSSDIQLLKNGKGGEFLVGIRHQVHDEADENWLLRDDVRRGLEAVAAHDLAFDLLVRPRELPATIKIVQSIPEIRWVLDHIAKPDIANGKWEPWASLVSELADASPNCWVKLSGMCTEANWSTWTQEEIEPYVKHIVACFGPDRCMLGSDWPVSLLAGSYERTMKTVLELTAYLPPPQQTALQASNAVAAYRLKLERSK